MTTLSLSALVERLSPRTKSSLENAAALASSRTNFSVEMGHWLSAMITHNTLDWEELAQMNQVQVSTIAQELEQNLRSQKSGNSEIPGLSPHLVSIMKSAFMVASVEFDSDQIDSVHILHAYLTDDSIGALAQTESLSLRKINPASLKQLTNANQSESYSARIESAKTESANTPSLAQFTIDMTELASQGALDPVVGRDKEIRLMIDILLRRRQNNPILTGEAGVGKTAVVEGLAQKIFSGDVPPALQNVKVHSLDLALLQAGAGMKGEFEKRLKSLIQEIESSVEPIILFIDEAHGLIGSGGQAGQGDAANILKPALARGQLRTIAATTWAEYKKYFEKDSALTRRFQVIAVDEPSPEVAIEMLQGLLPVMEKHHGVSIRSEALSAAVNLSARYINGRQLPDKAISVLDTACSRVALSQHAIPALLEQKKEKKRVGEIKLNHLSQEAKLNPELLLEIEKLNATLAELDISIQSLNEQWEQEQNWVSEIDEIREQARDIGSDIDFNHYQSLETALSDSQEQLVFSDVSQRLVAEVISDWTGIPLGKLEDDEIKSILSLGQDLKQRVVGQDHALDIISRVIETARAQLSDESRPNGVFLLTGPSGVGKTETALTIAEKVYGSEDSITTINMSEFKEEHKVSLLVGSPPGYVGYGEGGVLTEAVRRKPYSVVLLDEMEKAHPGVQDIFYQVFDKGVLTDGEGREIDFRNTIIIMTANTGTDTTISLFEDPELAPESDALLEALEEDLLNDFKPAFLGRINTIPYLPLGDEILSDITKLKLNKIKNRVEQQYKAKLVFSNELIQSLITKSNCINSGARAIQNTIDNTMLPLISEEILRSILNDESFRKIIVTGSLDSLKIEIN